MSSNNRKKRKKNCKIRRIVFHLVFGLIFTGVTAPLVIFHGPFTNVKKTIVDASMTTLSHQWIAKLFLSDADIQKIEVKIQFKLCRREMVTISSLLIVMTKALKDIVFQME